MGGTRASPSSYGGEDQILPPPFHPEHLRGPCEQRLMRKPLVIIGPCFGAFGEASQEVHDLLEEVANAMVKKQGVADGLGTELKDIKGTIKQRILSASSECGASRQCARACAAAREARMPRVGIASRAKARGQAAGWQHAQQQL